MARKRQRRRPAAATAADHQGHHTNLDDDIGVSKTTRQHINVNGETVVIHQISTQDEGVLYTHKITVSACAVTCSMFIWWTGWIPEQHPYSPFHNTLR